MHEGFEQWELSLLLDGGGMTASWKSFEAYVRAISALRYGVPCLNEHVAGVDVDGVLNISADEKVLVEMTENVTLEKVRADVLKISAVRLAQLQAGVSCKGFVVLNGEPTSSMTELGTASHVSVLSISAFENAFFNFQAYTRLRSDLPFGSAVDSETGLNDTRRYVGVSFKEKDTGKAHDVKSICSELINGKKIVVTGDYGTGKSRLVREVFFLLKESVRDAGAYPLAINLRDHWGSSNFLEIISGHLQGIGLSTSVDNVVRLLRSRNLILLLDGFDEIGAQTHDGRLVDRIALRKHALRGVRDLLQQTGAGVLVTGRSHYFDDDQEVLEALGLAATHGPKLIDVPPSFTVAQAKQYLSDLGLSIDPPDWLPRKPLVFQIAADLDQQDLEKILKATTGPFEFWGLFLGSVTRREAKGVQDSISPGAIRQILVELGGISRQSKEPLGRFSPNAINEAYQAAIGTLPDAVGQQLLARMCTLGRIEPESPDRQFLDFNIADVVRAEHLIGKIAALDESATRSQWRLSLREVGIAQAANAIVSYDMEQLCFTMLNKFATCANRNLLGEIISILSLISKEQLDFKALALRDACLPVLIVDKGNITNLELSSCEITVLLLDIKTSATTKNFVIKDSIIMIVDGVTNSSALPKWITNCEVVSYEHDVSNSASIKSSSLPGGQKLLLSIIHKIFFQPGRGREENALLKGGYVKMFERRTVEDVLKKMSSEGLIEQIRGDNGDIYKPNRRFTERMARIKSELALSEDPLWLWAGTLKTG